MWVYKKCHYGKVILHVRAQKKNTKKKTIIMISTAFGPHSLYLQLSRASERCRNICQTECFSDCITWHDVTQHNLLSVRSQRQRAMRVSGGRRQMIPGTCETLAWLSMWQGRVGAGSSSVQTGSHELDTSSRECLVPWSKLFLNVLDLALDLSQRCPKDSPCVGLPAQCCLEKRLQTSSEYIDNWPNFQRIHNWTSGD